MRFIFIVKPSRFIERRRMVFLQCPHPVDFTVTLNLQMAFLWSQRAASATLVGTSGMAFVSNRLLTFPLTPPFPLTLTFPSSQGKESLVATVPTFVDPLRWRNSWIELTLSTAQKMPPHPLPLPRRERDGLPAGPAVEAEVRDFRYARVSRRLWLSKGEANLFRQPAGKWDETWPLRRLLMVRNLSSKARPVLGGFVWRLQQKPLSALQQTSPEHPELAKRQMAQHKRTNSSISVPLPLAPRGRVEIHAYKQTASVVMPSSVALRLAQGEREPFWQPVGIHHLGRLETFAGTRQRTIFKPQPGQGQVGDDGPRTLTSIPFPLLSPSLQGRERLVATDPTFVTSLRERHIKGALPRATHLPPFALSLSKGEREFLWQRAGKWGEAHPVRRPVLGGFAWPEHPEPAERPTAQQQRTTSLISVPSPLTPRGGLETRPDKRTAQAIPIGLPFVLRPGQDEGNFLRQRARIDSLVGPEAFAGVSQRSVLRKPHSEPPIHKYSLRLPSVSLSWDPRPPIPLTWMEKPSFEGVRPVEEQVEVIRQSTVPAQRNQAAPVTTGRGAATDINRIIDVNRLADQVYQVIERRIRSEREWRGYR